MEDNDTILRFLPMNLDTTSINHFYYYSEYIKNEISRMGGINLQDMVDDMKIDKRDHEIEKILNIEEEDENIIKK